jgi:Protein phosphatase 2C
VQVSHATRAGPGRVNEDLAASGPDWALVLDGATPMPGAATGCHHDVPWLVRRLAAALATRLTLAEVPLAPLLADAIGEVRDAHAGSCDLGNPETPSSTVAIARVRGDALEHLVLCDSPVVLGHAGGQITLIDDDRLARLPGGQPYTAELIRAHRNQPGGFWVASTDPAAAYEAVSGRTPLATITDAALLSDGVTRLTEWYGCSWPDLLSCLRDQGPDALIDRVREAELADPHPRYKQHDDATAVHLRW